ncbi:MAG: hypothetical protein WD178_05000 [Actinomycetota bacterium]
MSQAASRRIGELADSIRGFLNFATLPHMQSRPDPGVSNFVFGNPHEPPLPEYVSALQ